MSLALFDSVALSMLLSSQTTQKSGTEMWGQEHEKPKGQCFLLGVCPLPKLRSFYCRQPFKSIWLNVWTPPIKMPSRSPHTCITHAYMNGRLWSTQCLTVLSPGPLGCPRLVRKQLEFFFNVSSWTCKGLFKSYCKDLLIIPHLSLQCNCRKGTCPISPCDPRSTLIYLLHENHHLGWSPLGLVFICWIPYASECKMQNACLVFKDYAYMLKIAF